MTHNAEEDAPRRRYATVEEGAATVDMADVDDAPRVYIELRPEELRARLARAWDEGLGVGMDDFRSTNEENPYRGGDQCR